jgi:TldD protein
MSRRDPHNQPGHGCAGVGDHTVAASCSSGCEAEIHDKPDRDRQLDLADIGLRLAKRAGASYADIRIGRNCHEHIEAREERLERFNATSSLGFGLRVLLNGSWGFAASRSLDLDEFERVVGLAIGNAEASRPMQTRPIVLEDIPAYRAEWIMPMKIDPFTISADEKASKVLAINATALQAGADFCTSALDLAREERLFANSHGSSIFQVRVRCHPSFEVTAIDKQSGRFATRRSLAAPRGSGWEYIETYDFADEAARAADQARRKLGAKSVGPGKYDLVIDPTNLWLTIHETVGHSTELDRALGWEANFAGTSFVTHDQLDKLRFGSPLMTVTADRSQQGGLATVGFDDDGVCCTGAEFAIIENGVFRNYQMAIGQAPFIGRERSNGCAYCDSPVAFPIQRMPNISLQPNPAATSLVDLMADIKDGIYIIGDGSWNIDQQRDNFQFGGQLFYEIKNGQLGQMLRDLQTLLSGLDVELCRRRHP